MALTQPFSNPKQARDEPTALWIVERVIFEPRRPYAEIKYAVYRDAAHAALAGAQPLDTRDIPITDKPERTRIEDVDGVPTVVVIEEAAPDYTRLFGTEALDVLKANPIERAYAALKERPEFADAVDVLEDAAGAVRR